MALSHFNGIAVSGLSHFLGVAKANVSAINGIAAGFVTEVVVESDNFNDNSLDTGVWQTSGSGHSESSQQFSITSTATAHLRRIATLDLTNRSVIVEVPTGLSGNTGWATQLRTARSDALANSFIIDVNNGSLRFFSSGVSSGSIAYNSSTHRWWKMKFVGSTTIEFYTSPDGVNWTLQDSDTHAIDITAEFRYLRHFNSEGSSQTSAWDNYKVIEN